MPVLFSVHNDSFCGMGLFDVLHCRLETVRLMAVCFAVMNNRVGFLSAQFLIVPPVVACVPEIPHEPAEPSSFFNVRPAAFPSASVMNQDPPLTSSRFSFLMMSAITALSMFIIVSLRNKMKDRRIWDFFNLSGRMKHDGRFLNSVFLSSCW